MPIVFVHGITVRRENPEHARMMEAGKALLERIVLRGVPSLSSAEVRMPYWGRFGVSFAWDLACVPRDVSALEAFGGRARPKAALPALAALSPEAAVDALWAGAWDAAVRPEEKRALLDFAEAAVAVARSKGAASDLSKAGSDAALADRVCDAVPRETSARPARGGKKKESFGVISEAVEAISDELREAARKLLRKGSKAAADSVLRGYSRPIGTFIGDICAYLQDRDGRRDIVGLVAEELRRPGKPGEPLVAVGHSMGGNILYDVLTHYAKDVKVDVLLTVGSQVALFEEMKLYKASDRAVTAPRRVAVPPNVGRWLNVVDSADFLSFLVGPVFDGARDHAYDTGAPLGSAHSEYLMQPGFHVRLRERLKRLLP